MTRPSAVLELTKWRLRELWREPEVLFWVFAFPVLLAIALGIAFRNRGPAPVVVLVEEAPGAQALAELLDAGERIRAEVATAAEAAMGLRTGTAGVVAVPGDPVTFRYDSTRAESAFARLVVEDALQRGSGRQDVRAVRRVQVTEPGGRYIDFLVPGLLGMNIMSTGLWGVGFGIVQSRSRKLLKRLVVSPMRRHHYLLAQMLARLAFLVVEVGLLVAFGYFAFGVPFRGSLVAFGVVVFVGGAAFAGLGLLTGSRVQTVEGASGLMNVIMMPMWILSGVFFSRANFPDAAQPFIGALPLTALNDALRAVMLDGAPLATTGGGLGVMAAWGVVSFAVALRIFRWT